MYNFLMSIILRPATEGEETLLLSHNLVNRNQCYPQYMSAKLKVPKSKESVTVLTNNTRREKDYLY